MRWRWFVGPFTAATDGPAPGRAPAGRPRHPIGMRIVLLFGGVLAVAGAVVVVAVEFLFG